MDKTITMIELDNSASCLTNIPEDIKVIVSDFKGLSMKWNGMDYIHLYTMIQKLNIAAAICNLDRIRNVTYRIEMLLAKYEYDIPASNADMKMLSLLIYELSTLKT